MGLKDYLPERKEKGPPKPDPNLRLLQARVDKKLYARFTAKRKKDKVKIREFFEAAMKQYLDDA